MKTRIRSRAVGIALAALALVISYQNCGDDSQKYRGRFKLFENASALSCEQMKYVPVELSLPADARAGSPVEIRVLNADMFIPDTILLQVGSNGYCDVASADPQICSVRTEGTTLIVTTTFSTATNHSIILTAFDYCRYGRAKIESLCVEGPGQSCPAENHSESVLAGLCQDKKQSMETCKESSECCSNNCVDEKCMPSSVPVIN